MNEIRYLDSLLASGIRPGLTRMRRFLKAEGNPHRASPAVVVAGTNGKGSTAATLASILTAAGYRTGFYSSPHLVSIHERWQIDGEPVTRADLNLAIRRLRKVHERLGLAPTYFEALTLLAFFIFEATECEVMVLETGMGGRLDATNVVKPVVSVITPIGLDHMEWLGSTVREIAREKAGIIHREGAALTSNRVPVVLDVLRRRAKARGVRLHRLWRQVVISPRRGGVNSFGLKTPAGRYRLDSPLRGEHQRENIALAVRAAELMASRFPAVDRKSIVAGVSSTRWRGRLERFDLGSSVVTVDGAHNAHAVARIASHVDATMSRPRALVFGALRDKNVAEMIDLLVPQFDSVITTRPDSERAMPPEELATLIRLGHDVPVRAIAAPGRAVSAAARQAPEVLVCGSLYLAGAAIAALDRRLKR